MRLERRIAATPMIVFSYLTDPAKFVLWMGVGAELDPKPGGRYRIDAGGGNVAIGEYQEVDPPRRLVLTWGWESDPAVPPGSTTVEITLEPDGPGTLLRLTHLGLNSAASREVHAQGWAHYTGQLAEVLAS